MNELDHLVVAARTLEEGARWIEDELGAATIAGGKHATMGTHNRLLALGGRRYLEVIAIDPDVTPPSRPRWFSLDDPAMRARLARGPALIHWVERTADLDEAVRIYSGDVEILSLGRGPYRWRIAVPRDGAIPGNGKLPTLIQWESGHPAGALPSSGVALERFEHTGARLEAVFSTPRGTRTIMGQGAE